MAEEKPWKKAGDNLVILDFHYFVWWVLSLVSARPARGKEGWDVPGVDGLIYFYDEERAIPKKAIVQVRIDPVQICDIRDFNSLIDREKAVLGICITLEGPADCVTEEAAAAGLYEGECAQGPGVPKLQVFSIAALLRGRRPELPRFTPGTLK